MRPPSARPPEAELRLELPDPPLGDPEEPLQGRHVHGAGREPPPVALLEELDDLVGLVGLDAGREEQLADPGQREAGLGHVEPVGDEAGNRVRHMAEEVRGRAAIMLLRAARSFLPASP